MGRNTKLTKERQADMLKYRGLGMTDKDVCACVGITTECLYNWLRRGEAGEVKTYSDFSVLWKKAESEWVAARVKNIQEAALGGQEIREQRIISRKMADGNAEVVEQTVTISKARPIWQADAWLLERRRRKDYGRHDRVDNYNVDLSKLTNEQVERLSKGEAIDVVIATSSPGGIGAEEEGES